jgi:hypothetical protein
MAAWQFRPNKYIQRLMCVDVMRRLRAFRPLDEYSYIGLGGYEFVDFDLVYRALGISAMTSIEEKGSVERLVFNRPFAGVVIEWGHTKERLPTLSLDRPLIVWLDYCGAVEKDILSDVLLLGEMLLAGSMLLVSVNADTPQDGTRLDKLEQRVTRERIPLDITADSQLDGWQYAAVQRRVLFGEVRAGLAKRQDGRRFEQLVHINYRDTRRMQTWGGVFVDTAVETKFESAGFRELPQVSTGDRAFLVKVPVLTAREVLALEQQMGNGEEPALPWMKDEELESFGRLHRWYPPVPAPM